MKNKYPLLESQKKFYDKYWSKDLTLNRRGVFLHYLLEGGILRKCINKFVVSRIKDIKATGPKNRTLTIIDMGCGDGWLTNILSQYGDITGVDLSTEVARTSYPKLEFKQVNVVTEKIEGIFDVVVSSEVLEHLTSENQQTYIKKALDILREGGYLILTTPNKRSDDDEKLRKKYLKLQPIENWIDKNTLASLLERHNFKIRFIGSGKFWPAFIQKHSLLNLLYEIFCVRMYNILYILIFKWLESSNKGTTLMVIAQKVSD